MKNTDKTMDKIVALCKNRGFIFAGSEIYGGLANTWDYGPLGVELKNNVKRAWWKKFVPAEEKVLIWDFLLPICILNLIVEFLQKVFTQLMQLSMERVIVLRFLWEFRRYLPIKLMQAVKSIFLILIRIFTVNT